MELDRGLEMDEIHVGMNIATEGFQQSSHLGGASSLRKNLSVAKPLSIADIHFMNRDNVFP